jgi:hypothetical protein
MPAVKTAGIFVLAMEALSAAREEVRLRKFKKRALFKVFSDRCNDRS